HGLQELEEHFVDGGQIVFGRLRRHGAVEFAVALADDAIDRFGEVDKEGKRIPGGFQYAGFEPQRGVTVFELRQHGAELVFAVVTHDVLTPAGDGRSLDVDHE